MQHFKSLNSVLVAFSLHQRVPAHSKHITACLNFAVGPLPSCATSDPFFLVTHEILGTRDPVTHLGAPSQEARLPLGRFLLFIPLFCSWSLTVVTGQIIKCIRVSITGKENFHEYVTGFWGATVPF